MKVSILVPVFNGEPYLADCLDSILCQDFRDMEILIANDCSTDGTGETIRKFAARDARIRWWQNSKNIGSAANHNLCLREARGEFIKFVHADDKLLKPSVVTQMVDILEANPAVSLVATAALIIDEQSRVLRVENAFQKTANWDGKAAIVRCLEENANIIGEPVRTMFRKSQVARGIDERYRQIWDFEMWFHLLEHGQFAYLAEPLVAWRVHPKQMTVKNRRTSVADDEHLLLLTDYHRRSWLNEVATPRMWFSQIRALRRQYGARASEITAEMARRLGPGCFTYCWMERKLTRPVKKLMKQIYSMK